MIKYKKIILLIAVVFCSTRAILAQTKNPVQTLSAFIESLGKQDVNTARTFATSDSKPMLDLIEMGINMMKAKAQQSGKALLAFSMKMLDIGKPFVQGNYATVNTTEKTSKETVAFSLRKENGEWKVIFNQAALTKMAADKGIDVNKMPLNKPVQQ
jgi:hypothetical protein